LAEEGRNEVLKFVTMLAALQIGAPAITDDLSTAVEGYTAAAIR